MAHCMLVCPSPPGAIVHSCLSTSQYWNTWGVPECYSGIEDFNESAKRSWKPRVQQEMFCEPEHSVIIDLMTIGVIQNILRARAT